MLAPLLCGEASNTFAIDPAIFWRYISTSARGNGDTSDSIVEGTSDFLRITFY